MLDTTRHASATAYEVPERMREVATVRDVSCVFPWCPRRTRRCDADHVVPHEAGGPTCSCNLAPLCRWHHRLKTHHPGWSYLVVEPGTYL